MYRDGSPVSASVSQLSSFLTGTSQLKQNAKAHSYICSICRTAFLCTTSEKMLRDHVAAKHDKATFEVRLSAERPICCAVF